MSVSAEAMQARVDEACRRISDALIYDHDEAGLYLTWDQIYSRTDLAHWPTRDAAAPEEDC